MKGPLLHRFHQNNHWLRAKEQQTSIPEGAALPCNMVTCHIMMAMPAVFLRPSLQRFSMVQFQRVPAGLYVSLWMSGRLGIKPAGLTAKLEVDYLNKLAADTIIVCSTELLSTERRKVWMKAHVYDGHTGKECARGRALFVAPRWSTLVRALLPFGQRKE
jgi:hypothetical protein